MPAPGECRRDCYKIISSAVAIDRSLRRTGHGRVFFDIALTVKHRHYLREARPAPMLHATGARTDICCTGGRSSTHAAAASDAGVTVVTARSYSWS